MTEMRRTLAGGLGPSGLLLLLGLALVACGGAPRHPATVQPPAPRIVAIGDVHGDLEAARAALRLAGAIDEQDRWIGGSLVVVQTGDQLDRGSDERPLLHLFDELKRQAARAGGAFHALNGNHELMNALLDLRYVTEEGFAAFADLAPDDAASDSVLAALPPEQRGRAVAFRPGGPYAELLARRNTILRVGDNLFVHGGVLPAHAEHGIDRINEEVRAWLRGVAPAPPWSRGSDTPIWTRAYSQDVDSAACDSAATVLAAVGARRMIVGHTVHRSGITSYCEGRVWAIDVGLAAHYGGPLEVLEIVGDTVRPLRAPGGP